MPRHIFKNLFAALLLALCAASPAQAQKVTFDDVLEIRLRDMGPIYQNRQVKGYYMFYYVEKKDSKHANFKLVVLDSDLNKVSEKNMTESKYLSLKEAGYDEVSLFFVFYESKERKLEFRRYDMEGKLLSKKSEELNRREAFLYQNPGTNSEMGGAHLTPVIGKGFAHYSPQKNKKFGYAIRFFAEDGGKDWHHESKEDSEEIENAVFLGYNDHLLLNNVIKKGRANSRDLDFYLQGIEIATGKVAFEKSLDDKKYAIQLLNAFPDPSGEIIVTGLYFDVDDKLAKAKSLGLFTGKMNERGEFTSKQFISWEKDVAKKLPVNRKGKIEGGGYVFFHKATRTSDGKIFAVGEMYGKEANGGAIAFGVLAAATGTASSTSVVQIEVRDMVVFEFNPDLTLAGAKVFDKASSDIELPGGAEFYGTPFLGYYVKSVNGFDYMYTQENEDNTVISFCYDNYERIKGKSKNKRKHVLGVVSRRVGEAEYTTDKVDLQTDASFIRSFPAKPGHVLLMEYYKKEKKIDLHIEKFNN